jgi:hypothetical protein
VSTLAISSLSARAISCEYRYCPRCRREWPAKHQSCPQCVHWLGDRPLERTEWQLVPGPRSSTAAQSYELVGANAVVLRVVCDNPPTSEQSAAVAVVIGEVLEVADGSVCPVPDHGWLAWTMAGLRQAFQTGFEIERRLRAALPQVEKIFGYSGSIRWGVWTDQYVIPFDGPNSPAIKDITASAIFNFEPDDMLLSSESTYQANRSWEHFVAAPRRLLDGQEPFGYRTTGHKRPSALDHAEAADACPFIGRRRELLRIDEYRTGTRHTIKLAITASAGSGKTRLIKEWLRRHPDVRAVTANFSLFGGTVADFASQLAELPAYRLDCGALVEAIVGRVHRDKIDVLVLDDLHWADAGDMEFLRTLVAALPAVGMVVFLVARPSGRKQLNDLQPQFKLKLSPLPKPATEELAERLGASGTVAAVATLRSRGNPLFIEQFVAWATETDFRGGPSGPRTLHQIIAARIGRLSNVRITELRDRLRWGRSWERQSVDDELGRLEAEVGRWLDRLETGDYADCVQAARHLVYLEKLDYEIFLTSLLLGRPRPRSSRLREAIDRLLVGSAPEILADLKQRAAKATAVTKENISREAKRAADVLFAVCNWTLAAEFYELARLGSLWERDEIGRRLAECLRHADTTIANDSVTHLGCRAQNIDLRPSVDMHDLPYVWAELGRRFHCGTYFARASKAAEVINDPALAAWAKSEAEQSRTNKETVAEN